MLHHIWNLRYFKYIRIIFSISLEPFILVINLNIMSSFSVFSTLVCVFKFILLLF